VGVTPNPKQLISLSQPISASPSLGYDGARFWVYFGTGRYLYGGLGLNDKSAYTATQSYYGIKEPITCPGEAFSWGTVTLSDLVRVDQIEVKMADSLDLADLSGTLPAEFGTSVTDLGELIDYITGTGCDASNILTGRGGWYRNFETSGFLERNLGKGILLGSLLTFTTYKPYSDVCTPEGESFLYGLLYNTGTSWHEVVFEGGTPPANVVNKIDLGRGMSITPNVHAGEQAGSTAFVQTSTGAIVKVPQLNPTSNYKTGRTYWQIIH
jgi:type IV pilus assembly protein PilY1